MKNYANYLKQPIIENDPQKVYFAAIMNIFDVNHDDLEDMRNFQSALLLAMEATKNYTEDWEDQCFDKSDEFRAQLINLKHDLNKILNL